jgi:hypothetical protein
MLLALKVDPELVVKSSRGKTPEQKRQEDLRIKLHMEKKLEKFIERNVVCTSRQHETSLQYEIKDGGTTISNQGTHRTTD